MGSQPKLRVHVEFDGHRQDFEGTADEVLKAFITFLNRTYPTFKVARRLMFTPDLVKLSETLVGVVEIAPEGLLLTSGRELPAEEAICLTLLGVYVASGLGKLDRESMSPRELSQTTGKALRTISNQLAWMVDEGIVRRVGRGEYQIGSRGIKRAEEIIQRIKSERRG
ncbi:MAG: hypothetical protein ACE5Z5_12400 [Candidatus Bathyarchaeia archaeon]